MNWKKGCLVAVGAFVALAVVVLVLVFWLTSGPVDAANRFLVFAGQGDLEAAYAEAAPALKAQQDERSFSEAMRRLGMTEHASASWTNRSVEGGKAELEGTVTTRGGDEIPVKITLVQVDDEWKVFSIEGPQAGAVVTSPGVEPPATASPAPTTPSPRVPVAPAGPLTLAPGPAGIPAAAELESLATESLLALNSSILARDFSTFYAGISELWRGQTTAQDLAAAFSQFMEREIDFSAIAEVRPVFEPAPSIDGDGVLHLSGHYPTTPVRVRFDLRFVYESAAWKLLGIEVNL